MVGIVAWTGRVLVRWVGLVGIVVWTGRVLVRRWVGLVGIVVWTGRVLVWRWVGLVGIVVRVRRNTNIWLGWHWWRSSILVIVLCLALRRK